MLSFSYIPLQLSHCLREDWGWLGTSCHSMLSLVRWYYRWVKYQYKECFRFRTHIVLTALWFSLCSVWDPFLARSTRICTVQKHLYHYSHQKKNTIDIWCIVHNFICLWSYLFKDCWLIVDVIVFLLAFQNMDLCCGIRISVIELVVFGFSITDLQSIEHFYPIPLSFTTYTSFSFQCVDVDHLDWCKVFNIDNIMNIQLTDDIATVLWRVIWKIHVLVVPYKVITHIFGHNHSGAIWSV